ncbi:MAG: heavy metal-responsive transcriptional regulator [Acidimicrobiia bacterium]|nr:heavy metal-responsive transcriptional regulator [Acidimicrobiia bacterium]NNL68606.1 heavy metal-responsive transcriptional regulator [Acidimicrobiia bacterium]
MRIGEIAQRAGVSTKTIRYYESIGLLPEPPRSGNGYRDFQVGASDRLEFIRDAQAAGLTLKEIASIIELRDQGRSTCRHVVSLLDGHLDELDRHISSLEKTRTKLSALRERARGLDPASCTDPNRCQTISLVSESHATGS